MTAAEKRAESVNRFKKLFALAMPNSPWGTMTPHIEHCLELVPFTDDEPAAPVDWRDQAVALGTGWEKSDEDMNLCVTGGTFKVNPGGRLWVNGCVLADFNNDPLARCITIDKFLADLGVGA